MFHVKPALILRAWFQWLGKKIIKLTLSAKKLLNEIKEVHGDDLLFHQSGGCCDGSAPMCFPAKEYQVGNSDVKLGEVDGTPFYMNEDQYEKWKHTDLTIDAVKGIGGMFSLDNGTGQRFLTKSEICVVVDNDKKQTNYSLYRQAEKYLYLINYEPNFAYRCKKKIFRIF